MEISVTCTELGVELDHKTLFDYFFNQLTLYLTFHMDLFICKCITCSEVTLIKTKGFLSKGTDKWIKRCFGEQYSCRILH